VRKKALKKTILILMGGPSSEYKVSLATGKNVLTALQEKYKAVACKLPQGNRWHSTLLRCIATYRPYAVFIAMHGKYGEDGTVQGLLESLGIPYTGSGILASALGMDKPRSSAIFRDAGLNVPDFEVISAHHYQNFASIAKRWGWPLVVKPADHGSSIGVNIVKNVHELRQAVREASRYSERLIIQKFISGREITCGVLEDLNGTLIPLPPIEIKPKKEIFYDYRSKYADGGSEHIIPPHGLTPKIIKKIKDTACRAHTLIGCSGISRSDFILDKNGKLYILEINTIPGMTKTSLIPEAAKKAGIDFPLLLDMLIHAAMKPRRG